MSTTKVTAHSTRYMTSSMTPSRSSPPSWSTSRSSTGAWRSSSLTNSITPSWSPFSPSTSSVSGGGGGGGGRVSTLAATLSTSLFNTTTSGGGAGSSGGTERRMSFADDDHVDAVLRHYNGSYGDGGDPSGVALSNQTSSSFHYYGNAVVVPLCVFLSVAMVLAVVGNVMVILTIIKHKTMRTRTNMFIVNLAVADILVAVFDMPFSILTLINGDWVFGTGFCAFNGITMALFLDASIHTLMYISIHKYISITRPFSRFMTPRRIWVMIAVTWIWSGTYAIGGAAGWTDNVYKKGASQCGPAYPVGLLKFTHSLCNTLFNFLIPLGVMTFCYFRIFREIRQHMWRMRENTNMDMKNSLLLQKRISVTLIGVLICFLICWSPYIFYSSYASVAKDKVPLILNPLAYWCGYINSACNPIIYAFRSPSFRQGYYSIVCGRQRQFQSTGSFSQRSPSFRRKTLPGAVRQNSQTTGTNGGDSGSSGTKKDKQIMSPCKRKPKRLISMNSWANASLSAPMPVTPDAEFSPGRPGFRRPSRSDPIMASESPPLLPRGYHGNGEPEVAPSVVPSSPCKALAENSITMLSPILEGSVENLGLLAMTSADPDESRPETKPEEVPDESDHDEAFVDLDRGVAKGVGQNGGVRFQMATGDGVNKMTAENGTEEMSSTRRLVRAKNLSNRSDDSERGEEGEVNS